MQAPQTDEPVYADQTPSDAMENDPQLSNEEDVPEAQPRKRRRGLFARIFGLDENDPPIIERRPRKDGTLY